MGIRSRIRTLGLREQVAWMRVYYPSFQCSLRGGSMVCRGQLTPTPMSRTYDFRLDYRIKRTPRISIENPRLKRRSPEERIPHTYKGDRPCTFFPGAGEWRSDKRLALTVVPWLSLWLFYYEVWLATGVWRGGGVHPSGHGITEDDTANDD